MTLTLCTEEKLYRHSLLSLQWMVAFITYNSNFAIGSPSQAMKCNNYTQLNTILHYIHQLYFTHFCYLTDHETDKPSQKSIIISQYKFSVKSLIYKECTLQLAETHSPQRLHTMSCQGVSPSSAHLAPVGNLH
jgi:hypothetical protein